MLARVGIQSAPSPHAISNTHVSSGRHATTVATVIDPQAASLGRCEALSGAATCDAAPPRSCELPPCRSIDARRPRELRAELSRSRPRVLLRDSSPRSGAPDARSRGLRTRGRCQEMLTALVTGV